MAATLICQYEDTKCKICGESIPVDSKFRYLGPGQTYHLSADCPARGSTPEAMAWECLAEYEEFLLELEN